MNILLNKEHLISALNGFIPNGEIFQIHDQGEYGEVIISLWNEDRESKEFFADFLEYCKISQNAKAVKEMEDREIANEKFVIERDKWLSEE
jgi:RNA binding exosome subunit